MWTFLSGLIIGIIIGHFTFGLLIVSAINKDPNKVHQIIVTVEEQLKQTKN